jgi:hypothetical protein
LYGDTTNELVRHINVQARPSSRKVSQYDVPPDMLTPDVELMDLFLQTAVQRVKDINENLENTCNINREAPQLSLPFKQRNL